MAAVLVLILSILFGYFGKRLKILPESTAHVLTQLILYFVLPCFVFYAVSNVGISIDSIKMGLVPWIFVLVASIFFMAGEKIFGWDKKTTGALILCNGLSNTSFLGFPFLEAFLGPQALGRAIFPDQLGSFFMLSTLVIWLGHHYAGTKLETKELFIKLFRTPSFLAFVLANITPVSFVPTFVLVGLGRVGVLLTPLALVVVGSRLEFGKGFHLKLSKPFWMGIFFKLILGPAIIAVMILPFHFSPLDYQVSVLEMAMAGMIVSNLIAQKNELDVELCVQTLAVGIPLSFITVPLWKLLLDWVAPLVR